MRKTPSKMHIHACMCMYVYVHVLTPSAKSAYPHVDHARSS